MHYQIHRYPSIIETLCGQIMVSGKMTVADRYRIKTAIMDEALSESDQVLINRLLYGVRHGLLRVVD
jgi:hypothetical protein